MGKICFLTDFSYFSSEDEVNVVLKLMKIYQYLPKWAGLCNSEILGK